MTYEAKIYNQHQVDDQALSVDDAFDAFRCNFPLVDAYVHHDGSSMDYKLPAAVSEAHAKQMEADAAAVIRNLNLPLKAELYTWKAGGVIFSQKLQIFYTIH